MKYNNKYIGNICRAFRNYCGYFQSEVAEELCCSRENISSFENGRNNNAIILMWYVEHGLKEFLDEYADVVIEELKEV